MSGKTFVDALLTFVHILTDRLLEFVLGWYWGEKKCVKAPSTKEQLNIVTKSAVELAELIRTRKLTSNAVVKAYMERMHATKTELNAIVDGPFMEALQEATNIDERIKNGEITEQEFAQKPFLGVPFTTKDSTSVGGRLQSLGLVSRKTTRATEDAECVQLMREAGAIILATSNIPEVNKWIESRNTPFGQTNNPYDLRRSVGGSSGGEGALISACCTGFGLGTDIGGSIRIPAFYCGIFGHKPTMNVINMRGCTFRTGNEEHTMVVAGPMTRYAKDLLPLFKVLVNAKSHIDLKLSESVNIKKLNYFYMTENGMRACNPVNADTLKMMFNVRQHFQTLTGQEVQLAKLPYLHLSGKMWRYWMTQEPADFNKLLGNGIILNPYVELVKKLFGCSEYTLAAIYSLIDGVLPAERASLMNTATAKCMEVLNKLLGNNGVLLFPSSPRTAPFHYYPLVKFQDFAYFSIFNVLKVPVTQVPMGLDANGLPLGIQVVSTSNNDRLCLAVAEELERAFGGWVPPFTTQN